MKIILKSDQTQNLFVEIDKVLYRIQNYTYNTSLILIGYYSFIPKNKYFEVEVDSIEIDEQTAIIFVKNSKGDIVSLSELETLNWL